MNSEDEVFEGGKDDKEESGSEEEIIIEEDEESEKSEIDLEKEAEELGILGSSKVIPPAKEEEKVESQKSLGKNETEPEDK